MSEWKNIFEILNITNDTVCLYFRIKNFKSTSNLAPVIPNTKTLPTEVPVVSVLSENHNKESFKEPEPSAPVFMILPSSAIVDEGGRVKFCTKVSGNPVPNVAWSINNLDVFSVMFI